MDAPGATLSPLQLRLFGPMDAHVGSAPLPPLRTRRGRWLLALLALRHDREVEREWLAGTLWPDSGEEQALASLRRTLTDLRDALGEAAPRLYAPTPHSLRLELEGADVDVVTFDRAISRQETQGLEEAVQLYRGPLMEGCAEEWALQERLIRYEAWLQALETLAGRALDGAQPEQAIPRLKQIIASDSYRETAHRALIQAQFQSGHYAAAVEGYRALRLFLRRELNTEPDAETTALYRRLRAESKQRALAAQNPAAPAASVAPSKSASSPAPKGVLPRPLSSFLGREADIQDVREQMEAARLVTLLGSGGVGKTRLAIQVASEAQSEFAGGVWFVDLAPLADPARVPQAVAATLGLREETAHSLLEQLCAAISGPPLLLVLDNCEHLLEACARLTETLLQVCPQLRVLATSREALRLEGEIVWRVPPLPVPEAMPDSEAEMAATLHRYEATRLFLERAQAGGSPPITKASQAQAVAQVCRRLDGMPLAIELAAARVKILSVEQIARRLDDRFRLLTEGSRTALPRQRTLRALIDWSYDLLDGPERLLFQRLSVFQGGWTVEAAEAICDCRLPLHDGGLLSEAIANRTEFSESIENRKSKIENWEVLDVLTSLADKSLVICDNQGMSARCGMLESVREYARERLEESEDAGALRDRHAAYFAQQAQQWGETLSGAQAAETLQAFQDDIENVRQGMDRAAQSGDAAATIAYGKALFGYLRMRGLYSECDARLAQAETAARGCGDRVSLARLLNQRGLIAWERFQLDAARSLFTESYAISRELDDKPRMLSALVNLGNIAWGHSEYPEAQRIYLQALALAQETEQTRHEATLRLNLGILAIERGDFPEAQGYLEASLEMHERLNSEEYQAHAYYNLAELSRRQGRFDEALERAGQSRRLYAGLGSKRGLALAEVRIGMNLEESGRLAEAAAHVEEGLRIAQEIGDRAGEMYALEMQARLSSREGSLAEARDLFRRSLAIAVQVGDRKQVMQGLSRYGAALLAAGQPEEACRMLQSAERERERLGVTDAFLAARLAEAEAALEPESARRLDGQALTVEEAMARMRALAS